MRALLFTVVGVIVAITAAISYFAFSPAPEPASNSLKLVIETGSIPTTSPAAEQDSGARPSGASGVDGSGSRQAPSEKTLDEVIAARLQQNENDGTREGPASAPGVSPIAAGTTPGRPIAAAEPTADQISGTQTGSTRGSAQADGDVAGDAGTPSGTVSITQMLAAELNNTKGKGAGDDATPDQEAAQDDVSDQQLAREAVSESEDSVKASATSEPGKNLGRLTTSASSLAAGDDTRSAVNTGQANTAEPANIKEAPATASGSPTGGTATAALDPALGQQSGSDTRSAETATPATKPQNVDDSQEQQPKPRPQGLAAADAPTLPRQRGSFALQGRIALIVRGLGVKSDLTERAIAQMPRQVAMAFVPYGDNLKDWTRRARQDRHEILIQVPLEPEGYPDTNPGPHTLLTSLSIDENLEHLDWLLDRFSGITGVTNYLGSKFASSPGAFAPVLMELKARDLLYIDDSKAANATTRQLAQQISLAYSVADVLIDAKRTPEAIRQKLSTLEARAKQDGAAIAIGHAHGATLAALEDWMGTLNDKGLALVPVTELTRPPEREVSQSTGG